MDLDEVACILCLLYWADLQANICMQDHEQCYLREHSKHLSYLWWVFFLECWQEAARSRFCYCYYYIKLFLVQIFVSRKKGKTGRENSTEIGCHQSQPGKNRWIEPPASWKCPDAGIFAIFQKVLPVFQPGNQPDAGVTMDEWLRLNDSCQRM